VRKAFVSLLPPPGLFYPNPRTDYANTRTDFALRQIARGVYAGSLGECNEEKVSLTGESHVPQGFPSHRFAVYSLVLPRLSQKRDSEGSGAGSDRDC
jgi:hypothetical protein